MVTLLLQLQLATQQHLQQEVVQNSGEVSMQLAWLVNSRQR
jgi:hypothetical protein